jgi:hypothetical protein
MTAGPAHVDPPPHPLYALTTSELSQYGRDLEHALTILLNPSPARRELRQRLAEVQAEQHSRNQISAGHLA